jgi:hypothetical protein
MYPSYTLIISIKQLCFFQITLICLFKTTLQLIFMRLQKVLFFRSPASLAYSTWIQYSSCYTPSYFGSWARPEPTTYSHIAREPCGSRIDSHGSCICLVLAIYSVFSL